MDFTALLGALQSTDTAQIRAAEEQYEAFIKAQPLEFLQLACQTLSDPTNGRFMAVLLRKELVSGADTAYARCPAAHTSVQTCLLQALSTVTERAHLMQIGVAVANLMSTLCSPMEKEPDMRYWPAATQWIESNYQSANEVHRMVCYNIIQELSGILAGAMAKWPACKDIVVAGLNDSCAQVVEYSVTAACTLVLLVTDVAPVLFPPICLALTTSLTKQAWDLSAHIMQELAVIGEANGSLLRASVPQFLTILSQLVTNSTIIDSVRHVAVELVCVLCEGSPRKCRQSVNDVGTIIANGLVPMMADLDDDEQAWDSTVPEAWEESDDLQVAETALDRIAIALGGSALLPVIESIVGETRQHSSWKIRHTSATMLAIVAEGFNTAASMPQVRGMVAVPLSLKNDPHPRVRWAVCNALGQMSTDFQPRLQAKLHQEVVTCLIDLTKDTQSVRVRSHAGAALINFVEYIEPETLKPYVEAILQVLVTLMSSDSRLAQENALTCLAAVADTIGRQFGQYYQSFAPTLIGQLHAALANNTSGSSVHTPFAARLIEAITLIGLSVGGETFSQQFPEVIGMILTAWDQHHENPDDLLTKHILFGLGRLVKVDKMQFAQYFPRVMPILMQITNQEFIQIIDGNDDEADGENVISLGDLAIQINTPAIEEAEIGLSIMGTVLSSSPDAMMPFLEQAFKTWVTQSQAKMEAYVRMNATTCIASAPKAIMKSSMPDQQKASIIEGYINESLKAIVAVLNEEDSVEVMPVLCMAVVGFVKSMQSMQDKVPVPAARIMGELSDALITMSNTATAEMESEFEDMETDMPESVEDQATLADKHEQFFLCLDEIGDVLGSFFTVYGDQYLPIFQSVVKSTVDRWAMMQGPLGSRFRVAALSVLIELITHTSAEAATPAVQTYLPLITQCLATNSLPLAQTAVFCAGVIAERFPEAIKPHAPALASYCKARVESPDARDTEDSTLVTENCISATGRLLMACPDLIAPTFGGVQNAWQFYLTAAGSITHDEEEFKSTVDMLLALVQNKNFCSSPAILTSVLTPLVTLVFQSANYHKMASEEVLAEVGKSFQGLMANPGFMPVLQSVLASAEEWTRNNFTQTFQNQ
ncbi:hypothetical protein KIPB_000709 [Kipferlia bialata]|uniref:Importin subunit beta-1/Transportin-1-like TPR repeats domain-containing protein n=1 Tax=Kipferlia bialata TaxID=797122 RepID=A0A9K3CPK3_9EUKA|nr:hypothetical protein KIPB_000709 [Kipferlia bialata]|eukprot:g709.t1